MSGETWDPNVERGQSRQASASAHHCNDEMPPHSNNDTARDERSSVGEHARRSSVTSQGLPDQMSLAPHLAGDIQDFNAPPPTAEDTSTKSPQASGLVRAASITKTGKRPSRLMKEIAAHNEEPEHKVVMTQENLEIPGVWQTRYAQKVLNHKDKDKPPSPPKNLNVSRLVMNQVLPKNKVKDPNAYGGAGVPVIHPLDNSDENSDYRAAVYKSDESSIEGSSESVGDEAEVDPTYSTHQAAGVATFHKTPKKSKLNAARKKAGSREQLSNSYGEEVHKAESLYDEWKKAKERILELLASPGYSPKQAINTEPEVDLPAYHPYAEVPPGYNLSMEHGLYVFSPTQAIFQDFDQFLEVVENTAGRLKGVVKVVVPTGCVQSLQEHTVITSKYIGNLLGTASHMADVGPQTSKHASKLQTYKLKMTVNENTRSNTAMVYDVRSEPKSTVPAASWRETIEGHRNYIVGRWSLDGHEQHDAWKHVNYENMYPESKMVAEFENPEEDAMYAMDNDANDNLRRALRCADPKLVDYTGNSLMKSKSRIPGIHSPYFYVSHSQGTPFGMHVEDFAAYSLNYLHCGAPKCWRVIAPKDHAKLEEILYAFLNPEERLLSSGASFKPKRPPQCSQFLRHNSLYVPTELLQLLDIEYTLVVQHQGEMVITFPYAYHQGYNAGPNIAEAIGYASDRWEVFIREGLYQKCQKLRCMVEPIKMDLEFAKASRGVRRSSQRIVARTRQLSSATQTPATAYIARVLRSRSHSEHSLPKAKPGVFPAIRLRSEGAKRLRSGVLKPDWEGDDGEWDSDQSSSGVPQKTRGVARKRKAMDNQGNPLKLKSDRGGNNVGSIDLFSPSADDPMELDEGHEIVGDKHHQEGALRTAVSLLDAPRGISDQSHSQQSAGLSTSIVDGLGQISKRTAEPIQNPFVGNLHNSSPQQPSLASQISLNHTPENDDGDYLELLALSRRSQNKISDSDDSDALYRAWTASDNAQQKQQSEKIKESELLATTANILKSHRRAPSVPTLQMPTPAASTGNVSDSSPGGKIGLGSSRDSSVEPQRRGSSFSAKPDYSTPWGWAKSAGKR